jgi:putative ABC transport system permease protein
MKNSDIGFDRENIVVVTVPWYNIKKGKYGVIKEELLQNSSIKSVSVSSSTPVAIGNEDNAKIESENAGKMLDIPHSCRAYIDYDYIDLYNIKILQGRNFSPSFVTDKKQGVIVNETMIKEAGLKNPIGKKLTREDIKNGRIIGIIKDFHFLSFKDKIEPLFFSLATEIGPRISIKISPGNIKQTMNDIETVFHKHISNYIFDYDFLKDEYNRMYKAEEKLRKILISFALIAIIIACLGLFGLVSFVTERRTKEIGIRKAIGASISNIMTLLVKEFLILVCFSMGIALPLAFYVMNKWLENYVYRITISVWILLMAVLITLLITSFTVLFQALKTAKANPVDSLRYE